MDIRQFVSQLFFDSSRLSIESLLHTHTPLENTTDFCTALQNFNIRRQKFVLCAQKKIFQHTKNISFALHKNSICTAKIAISTFSHTFGILFSFWHTFSYFPILSQLLAHCANLSKSDQSKTGLVFNYFNWELTVLSTRSSEGS
jgi:hypothetical protein